MSESYLTLTAGDLLRVLEGQDVRLMIRGDRLRLDAPQGSVTQELRQALRKHKPELIELIRCRPSEVPESGKVAAMSIDDFAKAGLILKIDSEILGTAILLVSDNVPNRRLIKLGLPVYRASEMRKLAIFQPPAWALQRIHEVKAVFNGTITKVEAPSSGLGMQSPPTESQTD